MLDINKKEDSGPSEITSATPEIPQTEDQPKERLPSETTEEGILTPERAFEEPETKIEQVKERVAEIEDVATRKKTTPVSPIMKDKQVLEDLHEIMNMDKPKQVKVLVYLAFKKGVHYAANIAKKLKDPYLMDEFHDTLVNELYALLLKKRKVKQK